MIQPTNDESFAAYIDATAALLELSINPKYRAGVELHFVRLAALARSVVEHPLEFSDEPAPSFHPGRVA